MTPTLQPLRGPRKSRSRGSLRRFDVQHPWNKRNDDGHEIREALVSHQVHLETLVHESRSSRNPPGVHVGSAPMYTVASPALTITKLGPDWPCHPKLPPGAILFRRTWMSEAFVVLMLALHGPIEPFVSMRPKPPIPKTVPCTLEGGVARTVPAYTTATPTTTTETAQSNLDLISPPFPREATYPPRAAIGNVRTSELWCVLCRFVGAEPAGQLGA